MQSSEDNTKSKNILPEGWEMAPTIEDLKKDLTGAMSDNQTRINQIKSWLDELNVEGSAVVKTRKNRSAVQPKLIRKQAEWRYPSLSQPFLSTRDIFNVSPTTYEDGKAAQQNALVLNHQFNTKIKKVSFIGDYVRVGVEEGSIICRVGWDYQERKVSTEQPVYQYTVSRDPSVMEVYEQLAQAMKQNPSVERTIDPVTLAGFKATQQLGRPIVAIPTGKTELVEEVKVVKNHPTVAVCDYDRVIIDPTCGNDIDNAQFIIYSFDTTIDALTREGDRYQNLADINLSAASATAQTEFQSQKSTFQFEDRLRKKITVHEYWGYADINGDGLLEPIVAAWAGNTMIRMEENPFPNGFLPFVVVPFLQRSRQLFGEPDGALLSDSQKITGAVTRGMLDLLGRSANSQQGTRKDALDFVNRRKYERGEDYEYNGNVDPRMAFYMHTYPEIPASAQYMLQMTSQEAESLTGVKAFNSGISSSSLGEVAAGIRGVLDAATKRETDILRRLADGLIQIARKFIAMNAVWLSEKEVVRITNDEFAVIDRDDLAGEFDVELSISTAEEDDSKAQELAFMLQTVGPNSDPKIVFKIMAETARLRKMPEVAKMLEEYEPQPDPLAVEKAQLEIELLKAQIAQIQNGSDATGIKAQLDQAKIGTEYAKAEQLQSQADMNTLNFVEQETGVKQERDLQKQGEQARANMALEEHKARLNPKSTKQ